MLIFSISFHNVLLFQSEYRKLSDGCKDYAVELLELCRSTDEIIAILNEDEEEGAEIGTGLARLKMAIKHDQKRVCDIIM